MIIGEFPVCRSLILKLQRKHTGRHMTLKINYQRMKKTLLYSLIIISYISLNTSCKKYEEGPGISLRSKKERASNSWVLEDVTEAGVSVINNFKNYLLVMEKSGFYSLSYELSGTAFAEEGTWRFANKNEQIEMLINQQGAAIQTITILKLKEKSFWFYTEDANAVRTEYHLKPQ